MAMLEVQNVHAYYGKIHALKDVSINIDKGEIVTLIGGNGAGKSTTLRTISGLLKPREGTVRLNGEDLTKYKAHEIVTKRIVQVPEGRKIFGQLTAFFKESGNLLWRDIDAAADFQHPTTGLQLQSLCFIGGC